MFKHEEYERFQGGSPEKAAEMVGFDFEQNVKKSDVLQTIRDGGIESTGAQIIIALYLYGKAGQDDILREQLLQELIEESEDRSLAA